MECITKFGYIRSNRNILHINIEHFVYENHTTSTWNWHLLQNYIIIVWMWFTSCKITPKEQINTRYHCIPAQMHMILEKHIERDNVGMTKRCFTLDHNYGLKCTFVIGLGSTYVPYHPYITILEQLISICVKLYLAKHLIIHRVFNDISEVLWKVGITSMTKHR